MDTIDIYNGYSNPIVLALGFFDCVHLGHKALIDDACRVAKTNNIESAVFTFDNDPSEILGGKKQIYRFDERLILFQKFELNHVIKMTLDKTNTQLSGEQFLDLLLSKFNVKCVVIGKDYTCGKNGEFKTKNVREYLEAKGVKVHVIPFVIVGTNKVSSSTIRKFLESGHVALANSMLTNNFFAVGKVVHDCARGTILGYPTANLEVPTNKLLIGEGVYATRVYTEDGNGYFAVTSVGKKPTFEDKKYTIETFIFNFEGDLYDKTIMLSFHAKLRDIVKFNSVPAFREQLAEDCKSAMDYFNLKVTL